MWVILTNQQTLVVKVCAINNIPGFCGSLNKKGIGCSPFFLSEYKRKKAVWLHETRQPKPPAVDGSQIFDNDDQAGNIKRQITMFCGLVTRGLQLWIFDVILESPVTFLDSKIPSKIPKLRARLVITIKNLNSLSLGRPFWFYIFFQPGLCHGCFCPVNFGRQTTLYSKKFAQY